MSNKPYDVIIWGASGFTGRLVAEYYLKQYGLGGELAWAMAGRNQKKLEEVRSELGNEDIPIVIADSMDKDSLVNLVNQTKVICTTVGPYAKYGSLLVEACVENNVDYCDLTGEVQWIRRMVDQHHEAAKAKGVKIVNCCGFDSIPSDMGVYFMQKSAQELKGEPFQQIKFRLKASKGGFSGGTLASLNNVMEEAYKDPSIFKVLQNPYGLNPEGERTGPDGKDLANVIYDEDAKSWIAPFVMAAINTKIVRRSNALMEYPYGKEFRYDEAMMSGSGGKGRFKGQIIRLGLGIMMSMKPGSLLSKISNMFLPKPGEGPSKEERETGFFNISMYGKFKDESLVVGKVIGDKDPGYGSTCKMLGESAVCLAKDELSEISGVLTPSSAMGDALLDRLQRNAGLTFEIKDSKVTANVG